MEWVLIIIASTTFRIGGATVNGNGYGESVSMQEFGTKDACIFASRKVFERARTVKAVCVPKGQQ